MTINAGWYAALRTGMQALWGGFAGWLVTLGVTIPAAWADFIIDTVLVAGTITLVARIIRWMESRPGDGWFDGACRTVAKWLMAGLARPPVYPVNPPPSAKTEPVSISYDDGKSRTAL